MRVDLVATTLPGRSIAVCTPSNGNTQRYVNVHVGLQDKKGNVVEPVSGDVAVARWSFDVEPVGDDVKGAYVQGKKGDRFFYLCWGAVDDFGHFNMFRRAKLMLDEVPAALWAQPVLTGELGLTMKDGSPLCAAVRPPVINWR